MKAKIYKEKGKNKRVIRKKVKAASQELLTRPPPLECWTNTQPPPAWLYILQPQYSSLLLRTPTKEANWYWWLP